MRTALIGLDYIIDIMHPEGKIAASAAQASARHVIVHANQALQLAQQRGWLRILVKVGVCARLCRPSGADRHVPSRPGAGCIRSRFARDGFSPGPARGIGRTRYH